MADDNVIELPHDKVWQSKTGFSIDSGGSAIKILYRSNEDKEFHQIQKEIGRLRIRSFPISGTEEVVKFIQDNCDTGSDGMAGKPQVTGIGCSKYRKELEAAFKSGITVHTEQDCFVNGLLVLYRSNKKASNVFHELPEEGLNEARERVQKQLKFFAALKAFSEGSEVTADSDQAAPSQHEGGSSSEAVSDKDLDVKSDFPCLQVMCGSGFVFQKIEAEGSFSFVDQTFKGGKCMHGLAKLLTGIEDFHEILKLAAEGDARKVDQTSTDLKIGLPPDDIYTILPEDVPVFPFGRPVAYEGETYNNKDILRGLFAVWCMELAQLTQYVCVTHKINNVYFCGGFPNNYLVRMLLTKELAFRNSLLEKEQVMNFQFVRHSSHLGALGAYCRNK